jgi:lipopolysaccharide exporter
MSNKGKAIKGGIWSTTATVLTTILQFGQIAILARMLTPAAFGVVSICTLVTTFFSVFVNLGFSNSIIYKQESNAKALSTLYYLNLILGVLAFTLIYFSSPLIVNFYHEPKLTKVVRLASLLFLIIYFGQIYSFLLQKELKFKAIAAIDIVGNVVGTAATILLAYLGYEELSLIYGGLALHTTRTILQVVFGRKLFTPTLHFDLSGVKDHLRFGAFNLGEGVVSFIQNNSDNILIGGMLGVKALGYYTLALQLAIFPVNKLNPIILQVAYPIIAKMKDDPQNLKKSYLKILDFLIFLNLPLLAGLFITAESVVPLLYGPGWESTFPLIKIFVVISFFSCINHPLFTLVYSKGKPNILFYLNLITLIIKLPLLYVLGKYWQVTGIAVAYLIATLVYFVLNFCIVHSLIGSFMKPFLRNTALPVAFCLLMVAVIAAYKYFVGYSGMTNTVAEITLGGIVYVGLALTFKISLTELRSLKASL